MLAGVECVCVGRRSLRSWLFIGGNKGGRGLLLYTAILTDGRVFFGAVGLGREGGSTFRTVLRACSCVGIRTNCDDDYLLHSARKAEAAKCFNGLIAS